MVNKLINDFYLSCRKDFSIVSINDENMRQFTNFLANFRENQVLEEINFELIVYEQSHYYCLEMTKNIIRNKTNKQEEIMKEFSAKAEKTKKEYLEIYSNRKNDIFVIKQISENYLKKIIEEKANIFKEHNFEVIEKRLNIVPVDPEKFMHFGYEKSFTNKNPEKIYSFVVDINKYLSSVFKESTKEILRDVLSDIKVKWEEIEMKEIST